MLSDELSTLPPATVISTRSMELVRSWDCRTTSSPVESTPTCGCGNANAGPRPRWAAARGGYPSREQAAVVSPSAPAAVPQDWLEDVCAAG